MQNYKKTIIAVAVIAAMTVGMTGCSDNENTENNSGANGAIPNLTEDGIMPPMSSNFEVTQEILNADIYSGLVQIGDTVIQLPTTVGDFLSAGATINDDTSEDFLMNSKEVKNVDMTIGGTQFRFLAENNESERISLKEAETNTIEIIGVATNIDETGTASSSEDIFFPLGIKVGDSIADLTEKWGEPTIDNLPSLIYAENTIHRRMFGDTRHGDVVVFLTECSIRMNVDRNTSLITELSMSAGSKIRNIRELNAETEKGVSAIKFNLPYELSIEDRLKEMSVNQVPDNRAFMGVEIDDEKFALIFRVENANALGASFGDVDENMITSHFESHISWIEDDTVELKYSLESIDFNDDSTLGKGIGYAEYKNTLIGHVFVVQSGRDRATTLEMMILPLNEESVLSENAINEFKRLMIEFVDSIEPN